MPTSDSSVLLKSTEAEAARPRFWSDEFFSRACDALNGSPELSPVFKGVRTKIIAEATDRGGAFMIEIKDGGVTARRAEQAEPADFRFSAPYDEWVAIVRDDAQLRGEVVKGKVKFRGSMPMMLLMLGKVSKAEKELVERMRLMNAEY